MSTPRIGRFEAPRARRGGFAGAKRARCVPLLARLHPALQGQSTAAPLCTSPPTHSKMEEGGGLSLAIAAFVSGFPVMLAGFCVAAGYSCLAVLPQGSLSTICAVLVTYKVSNTFSKHPWYLRF